MLYREPGSHLEVELLCGVCLRRGGSGSFRAKVCESEKRMFACEIFVGRVAIYLIKNTNVTTCRPREMSGPHSLATALRNHHHDRHHHPCRRRPSEICKFFKMLSFKENHFWVRNLLQVQKRGRQLMDFKDPDVITALHFSYYFLSFTTAPLSPSCS